jgi:perosamine synthetase
MLKTTEQAETARIHYTKPSITGLEVRYAEDAARNGWGPQCYAYIDRFETAFRDHLETRHAIATSSCTGALHMGLAALGIGPGDEVILADSNWIASAAPITYLGATPVFVDILADSWCIDPEKAEAAITPRTKAIIAVHLYGNLCDMDRLMAIGAAHDIAIIEDAAEAIGSIFKGRKAGSIGTFGTFSFHGTKTITTGEGGMFVTSDADLYQRVLTLSNHGRAAGQTRQFWPDMIGYKYKISNIQAAIGCAQIERIEELIVRKHDILTYYKERLEPHGFTMNPEPPGCRIGGWMPNAVFPRESGLTRDLVKDHFNRAGIDARVFFHPLSGLDFFEARPENRIAREIPERAINLPSYHDMTKTDLDRVIDTLLALVR